MWPAHAVAGTPGQRVVAPIAPRRGDLIAEGLSAFDGEAVVAALTRERQRALRDCLAEAVDRWIAKHRRIAEANRNSGAQLAEFGDDFCICHVGNIDLERSVGGAGYDRGSQRGIAAARDGEWSVGAGRCADPAKALFDLEEQSDAHEMPSLVRAGDVAGLVLDEGSDPRLPGERCSRKAAAIDRGHALVELAD